MKRLDLPDVTRVHTDRGSHIEPELDSAWSNTEKLAWQAATTAHDTGLRIVVHDEALIIDGQPMAGYYAINVEHIGTLSHDYRDAWTYLNGVATGAAAAMHADNERPIEEDS